MAVVAATVAYALVIPAGLLLFPALDRWLDCGRLESEMDSGPVLSILLTMIAVVSWLVFRGLLAERPRVVTAVSASLGAALALLMFPVYFLSSSPWTESVAAFRQACGIGNDSLLRGLVVFLPLLCVLVVQTLNPASRALSWRRGALTAAILVALWVAFGIWAQPFATFAETL